MTNHKFSYNWNLSDGYPSKGIEYHGSKVFSCFACGGGSTMGYKLAGFDVVGMNEIDPKMATCYIENHNPKYAFVEKIQDFKNRTNLPKELYDLWILDGSPPCSSFSDVGNREKDWGVEKFFKEGQEKQVLDTLFFDFIDLTKELQPKIAIAENVKGILKGNAKKYCIKIISEFKKAGYKVKEFLLNSDLMGVPQSRERVFFIAIRNDLAELLPENPSTLFNDFPLLDLVFFEDRIPFKEIKVNENQKPLTEYFKSIWDKRQMMDGGFRDINKREIGKETLFSHGFIYDFKPIPTQTADYKNILFDEPRYINDKEIVNGSTFPQDYNFLNCKVPYLCGMSVPPVMMAQIADRIYNQWISVLKSVKSLNRGVGESV